MNSLGLAYNMLGPLSGALTAKIILKIIVGCALMFEGLFWEQQEQGDNVKPFKADEVQAKAASFAKSTQRQMMSDIVEKSVRLSNCYSRSSAKAIAEQAILAAKKT